MLNFRFTYLWILLVFFLGGKIHSETPVQNFDTIQKVQPKDLKEDLKKSADTCHAIYKRQKNKRPRAKEVLVPQISEVVFVGIISHKTFIFSYTESVYTSFQHCINLKRGPPIA